MSCARSGRLDRVISARESGSCRHARCSPGHALLATLGLAGTLVAGALHGAELSGAATTLTYHAPAQHAVPRRVGGSSRGIPPALPAVAVLAPDHLGLTVSAQPTLFWFLSAPTDARIELALIQPGREAPLLELAVRGSQAGIHALELGRHDVQLVSGVEYEWSVAIVADSEQRSRDIVSGGAIMRVDRAVPPVADAATYAAQGLWYEAMMALERRAREHPGDEAVHMQRAALLDEVGLNEVAAFERRR